MIKYKPTTSSRRGTQLIRFRNSSTKDLPRMSKTVNYRAGRNNSGKITMRHKGGRVSRKYREIDFKYSVKDVEAKVVSIEYDPYRTARISMLSFSNGVFTYIIAPEGLQLGDKIIVSDKLEDITVGSSSKIGNLPESTQVFNIELVPGNGGVLVRSAGNYAIIQGKLENGYTQVKLPSGEIRLVNSDCYATIGLVSNIDNYKQKFGKAGRMRLKGVKPTVRGVAQSYKHPHAGGQGKSGRSGTGKPPKDPWGNKRGVITRKNKSTNKFIIKRRTSTLRPKNKPYKTI